MKKFWMVTMINAAITVTHDTKEKAISEAKRLARIHAGKVFYVTESVEAYKVEFPEPIEVRLED